MSSRGLPFLFDLKKYNSKTRNWIQKFMSKKHDQNKKDWTDPEATEQEAPESDEMENTKETGEEEENQTNPASELLRRLDEAEETARDMKEKYFRVMADLENYRRRAAKEKEDLRDYAIASVIEDLLPAMDNLRLGLEAARESEAAKGIADGFRMVADQLIKTLEGYGLEEKDPTGEIFDPNLHDCMSHQSDPETEEGVVLQTIRPAYRLKGRLIRPAYVIVSSGTPDSGENKGKQEDS